MQVGFIQDPCEFFGTNEYISKTFTPLWSLYYLRPLAAAAASRFGDDIYFVANVKTRTATERVLSRRQKVYFGSIAESFVHRRVSGFLTKEDFSDGGSLSRQV